MNKLLYDQAVSHRWIKKGIKRKTARRIVERYRHQYITGFDSRGTRMKDSAVKFYEKCQIVLSEERNT